MRFTSYIRRRIHTVHKSQCILLTATKITQPLLFFSRSSFSTHREAPNVFYATSSHNNLQLFSQWNSIVRVKSMNHGLINFIDTKAKCRNLKKLTFRGTLRQVFINQSLYIDWRYSQSCCHFRPSFVNCCPSNLLSGSTLLPSPPLTCVNKYTVYTYTVCKQG